MIWDPTLLFSPALSCLRDPSLLSWREEVRPKQKKEERTSYSYSWKVSSLVALADLL